MNLPGNIGNPLSCIGLSKWIKGVTLNCLLNLQTRFCTFNTIDADLVFREEFEPLLKKLVEIVCNLLMGGRHFVTK